MSSPHNFPLAKLRVIALKIKGAELAAKHLADMEEGGEIKEEHIRSQTVPLLLFFKGAMTPVEASLGTQDSTEVTSSGSD